MSYDYCNMCRGNVGRGVCITTRDGRVYRGVISVVNGSQVFITPIRGNYAPVSGKVPKHQKDISTAEGSRQTLEIQPVQWGYGYGGGGYDSGWWIAFASIAALAFLPFFFW